MLRGAIGSAKAKGRGLMLEIDTAAGPVLGHLPEGNTDLLTDVEYVFLGRFENVASAPASVLDTPALVVSLIAFRRPSSATVF